MEWLRRALVGSGWAVTGLTFATLACQLVSSPGRLIASVQALTPIWLPLAAIAFAAGVWHQRRMAIANAVAIGALIIFLLPLATSPTGASAGPEAASVTIASVNLYDTNDDIVAALDDVGRVNPDIVGFVEVTAAVGKTIDAHPLATEYPYKISLPGAGPKNGRTLWSRYPLVRDADNEGASYILTATATTPDGTVRVVLVHIPSPFKNTAVWNGEFDRLPDLVAAADQPTVVMGDFNASYMHPPFRSMVSRAGLIDSLPAVGKRFTMTWPNDRWFWPFVALDHVLVTPDIAVRQAAAFDVTGSDHAGVIATISIAIKP